MFALIPNVRFAKTHPSEMDDVLEILLRLIRREWATAFPQSDATVAARRTVYHLGTRPCSSNGICLVWVDIKGRCGIWKWAEGVVRSVVFSNSQDG